MAYTSLGFSLPDLTVSGKAAPSATYGGNLAVTIDVRNIAATTLTDPLAQEPGSTAHADAQGPVDVNVFITRTRRLNTSAVLIGTVTFPDGVSQNSLVEQTATLTLPDRPAGFPAGRFFVAFQVDPAAQVQDLDRTNNAFVVRQPVKLTGNPGAGVVPVALELPSTIQPGDTVQPNIRVENFGSVASGPIVVDLVTSPTRRLTSASRVVGRFQVPSVPALAETTSYRYVPGDVNLNPPGNNLVPGTTTSLNTVSYFDTTTTQNNIFTIYAAPVTLPSTPRRYFVGLVIEGSSNGTSLSQVYTAAVVPGLPQAGVLTDPAPEANQFPIPPYGAINQTTTTTTSTTTTDSSDE